MGGASWIIPALADLHQPRQRPILAVVGIAELFDVMPEGVGEGQFIHLWQYKDGAWKITRVISYDHRIAAK